MTEFFSRDGRKLWPAAVTAIAAALASPAYAQTANVTSANVNVINLLSPFLSLNSTAVGQQTLQTNLNQAVAINQNAGSVALLNNNYSTATLAALAISDENSLGAASTQLYGTTTSVGVAANLAGALPTQNTTAYGTLYNGAQQYGAFGSVLGPAYVNAVNPSSPSLPNTIALLTTAFNFTGNSLATGDSQVAKFYFANGTWNGTTQAVAPAGSTLPTFTLSSPNTTLPNTTNSVYDLAYGVTNKQTGQNQYGDSHPYQTYPAVSTTYTLYDPTVKTATTVVGAVNPDKPSSNPAFPSSHMAYAMTDGLLLGMLAPQLYQSTLLRASEIGESRIVIGVHYPTDIIASRSYISYDLAQYLTNPAYINNAAVTGTAVNLPSLFTAAQGEIQTQLGPAAVAASCGTSFATCATSSANVNPYAPSSTNAQVYEARLTYGLPIYTFAQAPREQAPAGGPDASILLATIYGGSTSAAQTLAPSGGIYGNLSTNTINQIVVNTETNALAAFYGTSLSYWSRINLYAAAGYFGAVTGTITLGSSDQVNTNVVVAGATTNVNGDVVPAGVLAGAGKVTGNVTFQSGGALGAQGNGTTSYSPLSVSGTTNFLSGSKIELTGVFLPGKSYTLLSSSGEISVNGSSPVTTITPSQVAVDTSTSGNLMTLFTGTPSVTGDPVLQVLLQANFGAAAQTKNQLAVANDLSAVANTGNYGAAGAAMLANIIGNNTVATAPAAYTLLSGEAASGAQQGAFQMMTEFLGLLTDPFVDGRGGGGGIGHSSFSNEDEPLPPELASAYAALTKAPPVKVAPFEQRWTTWGSAYGGANRTEGDPNGVGSHDLSAHTAGFAGGADYNVSPSTLLGFGLAGGGTNWGLAQGLGTGRSDAFQAGVYGKTTSGPAYLAASFAYTQHWMSTDRTAFASDHLTAKFNAESYGGRVEAGYRVASPVAAVTPYAAVNSQAFVTPNYSENDPSGGGFGLTYGGRTATDTRGEAGARFDHATVLDASSLLMLRAKLAYAHDWVSDPSLGAVFETLPGASFIVNGATPAHDSALASAGAELRLANGVVLGAKFDGEFTSHSQTYAGTGTVRYTW